MATLYTQEKSNIRKTYFLMFIFFGLISSLGYFVSYIYGDANIFYTFVIFSIIMNFFSYFFSDSVSLALAGAKEVKREDNKVLYDVVENLCIRSGIQIPKIHIIEESSPNAFATGRDQKHASIAVTRGLLNILDRTELEGVIAHELSHIQNRDILIATIVVTLVGIVSIISDVFLRNLFWSNNSKENKNAFVLIGAIIIAILAPLTATLIQLAISRKREFLADASGALMTRYPEGLASALQKISNTSTPLKHQYSAIAHLYISNPEGNSKSISSTISNLFSTHPKTEDRIKALLGK